VIRCGGILDFIGVLILNRLVLGLSDYSSIRSSSTVDLLVGLFFIIVVTCLESYLDGTIMGKLSAKRG